MNELERHHQMAVLCSQKGERFKWVTCMHVERIVGHFTDGATIGLANDLSVSVDTLEKYAMAYRMYASIRDVQPVSEQFHSMLDVRNRLSIKHFWTMAQLWHRYEFGVPELADYLVTAAENGTSVETMRSAIVGGQDVGYQTGWKQLLIRSVTSLIKVTEDYGVPEEIRALTKQYLKDVAVVMESMGEQK